MSDQKVDCIEEFLFTHTVKERLDIFLKTCLGELTRSRIQGLIKGGRVSVNGVIVFKPSRELEFGESIKILIPPPSPSMLIPQNIPLNIIFENRDLLVINKQAGMVVHPSPGHESGTLVHALLAHVPDLGGIGGVERPGIVHRLDKDTSGLIIVAKNEQSYYWLQDQFRNRLVIKTYLALVDGSPPTPHGRVEAPIGRHNFHRKVMAVVPLIQGRESISEYRTVEKFTSHTLLEVHPLTGRTHQIRVHMAYINCPITGDRIYGNKKQSIDISRQFLHSHRLKIILPGETEKKSFEAPLPDELNIVLDTLRRN